MGKQAKKTDISSILLADPGIGGSVHCIEQLSWVLLLKYLDCCESENAVRFKSNVNTQRPLLKAPYRWSDWASPKNANGELDEAMTESDLVKFVNGKLFPHFAKLSDKAGNTASSFTGSIPAILCMFGNRFESGKVLRKVLRYVDRIDFNSFEGLGEFNEDYKILLDRVMSESRSACEFYTHRPLIGAIVKALNPEFGERIFDPAAGTCGFLVEAQNHIKKKIGTLSPKQRGKLEGDSFYGSDSSPFAFLTGVLNLALNGINPSNFSFADIFAKTGSEFSEACKPDVILTNIPFGLELSTEQLNDFEIKHKSNELMYFQHILKILGSGGRAAVILPEFMLGRSDDAYKQVWKNFLENFNLHTIMSLPAGVFWPYSNIKSCVLFFDRTEKTRNVWYYQYDIKLNPFAGENLTEDDFVEFLNLYAKRETTTCSWMVPASELLKYLDLSPRNPAVFVESSSRELRKFALKKKNEIEELKTLQNECRNLLLKRLGEWFDQVKNCKSIDSLASVKGGKRLPKGGELLKKETKHPYIRISDFGDDGAIDDSNIKYLSENIFKKLKNYTVSTNDLCVSIAGTIGKSCIVPEGIDGAVLTENACKLTIGNQKALDVRYLYLYTLTSEFKEQARNASNGTAQPKLSLENLRKIEIPVASIEIQLELINLVWILVQRTLHSISEIIPLSDDDSITRRQKDLREIFGTIQNLKLPSDNGFLNEIPANGNGKVEFNVDVKSSFLAIMLAGGEIPGIQNNIIKKITFDGKIDGYKSNDLIVHLENKLTQEKSKLLGQIVELEEFTKNDSNFGEVISIAWKDYNNSDIFRQNRDAFAIITTPLSQKDRESLLHLLDSAKSKGNSEEFVQNLELALGSPDDCMEMLKTIKHLLKKANGGSAVKDSELFNFLKCINIYEFDPIWKTNILELLHSVMSDDAELDSHSMYSKIVEFVKSATLVSGSIESKDIPDALTNLVHPIESEKLTDTTSASTSATEPDWLNHPSSNLLANLVLIGSWNEKYQNDIEEICTFLDVNYDDLLMEVGKLIHFNDSPVSVKNGVWTISRKKELFKGLEANVSFSSIESFGHLAERVLSMSYPVFDMEPDQYYEESSNLHMPDYSLPLRKGISEGLALLGNYSSLHSKTSRPDSIDVPQTVLRNTLKNANWKLWCSLNDCFPELAEAAPQEFMFQLNAALSSSTSPFDEIFARTNSGIIRSGSISGILRALEALAWEAGCFQSAFSLLCKLASKSPGDLSEDRAFNSMLKILMPWHPQTLANARMRINAMENILNVNNTLGWELLLGTIPHQGQIPTKTCKPNWRRIHMANGENTVPRQEFWEQVNSFAELAVENVKDDSHRALQLIEHLKDLPDRAFSNFIENLSNPEFMELPEDERKEIWESLTLLTIKHRRYSKAEWALSSEKLSQIDRVTGLLAPVKLANLFQYLFSNKALVLIEEKTHWKDEEEKIASMRRSAIEKIMKQDSIDGVLEFAKTVSSPETLGIALAEIDKPDIDKGILPELLTSDQTALRTFISGYICKRHEHKSWQWSDNLAKSGWTREQLGQLLLNLPFEKHTWDRSRLWLKDNEALYWKNVRVPPYPTENLEVAAERLIEFDRPKAAVGCLNMLKRTKMQIDRNLLVRALLQASNSQELEQMDYYITMDLIRHLQSISEPEDSDYCEVEWEYLPSLAGYTADFQMTLERKLSSDPEFFCKIIQMAYRSTKTSAKHNRNSVPEKSTAEKALCLLNHWKSVPGTDSNGNFNPGKFKKWFQVAVNHCRKSGHLEVAKFHIGNVLVYSPEDRNREFWIDKSLVIILNEKGNYALRNGYKTGDLNGAMDYAVGSVKTENCNIVSEYNQKAESLENLGFHRFAGTLREISAEKVNQTEMLNSVFS